MSEDKNLDAFVSRLHSNRQQMETIADWHIRAYKEGGVELPWAIDSTWVNMNVYGDYVDGNRDLDTEASLEKLSKVVKFATKQKNVLVKKNYDDRDFELTVEITSDDESKSYTIMYYVKREAVCTRRVVGTKEIPEQIVPARTEEVVEWDCEPVSLLAIANRD